MHPRLGSGDVDHQQRLAALSRPSESPQEQAHELVQTSLAAVCAGAAFVSACAAPALAQNAQRPNILVIMADDVGYCERRHLQPRHDGADAEHRPHRRARASSSPTTTRSRAARRAARPSSPGSCRSAPACTRSACPARRSGIDQRDPTLAELLKQLGYRTGQFGKNHLGDRNEHLPTVNGFDEFYGNLYHLNTEEEPELRMWRNDPGSTPRYRPRGVLDCVATERGRPHGRPALRPGRQAADQGHRARSTTKRMETVDDEFLDRTKSSSRARRRRSSRSSPGSTRRRMHIYTHLKPESRHLASDISSEFDIYGSGMMEHDGHVGQLLEAARRPEDRREHDRRLHHRQRRDGVLVARRRHHAVPRREGHHLGRRRARADAGALAGADPDRARSPTASRPRGHVHDAGRRRRLRRRARQAQGARQGLHRRRRQPRALDRRRALGAQRRLLLRGQQLHRGAHRPLEVAHA